MNQKLSNNYPVHDYRICSSAELQSMDEDNSFPQFLINWGILLCHQIETEMNSRGLNAQINAWCAFMDPPEVHVEVETPERSGFSVWICGYHPSGAVMGHDTYVKCLDEGRLIKFICPDECGNCHISHLIDHLETCIKQEAGHDN